jgi:hypothetical protein
MNDQPVVGVAYVPVITGRCGDQRCFGIASLDYILNGGNCPDCGRPICNVSDFADIADSQHLRGALQGILRLCESMTSYTVPARLWRSQLLSLQSIIEAAMAVDDYLTDIQEETTAPVESSQTNGLDAQNNNHHEPPVGTTETGSHQSADQEQRPLIVTVPKTTKNAPKKQQKMVKGEE